MEQYYAVLLSSGIVVLGIGLITGLLRDHWIASRPLVAVLVGAALGPYGLGLLDLSKLGEPKILLEEVARLTLGLAMMATALRLPVHVKALWRGTIVVLLLVMPLMWLASAATAWLVLGLPVLLAALVGAIVTPTDPVLAGAILTGKLAENNVPARIRHLLSAEAAANDGLALLFVMLPALLLMHPPETALIDWATRVLLWEVIGGCAIGAGVGFIAGRTLHGAFDRGMTAPISLMTIAVALAVSVLAGLRLVHADGILAVFFAGLTFSLVVHSQLEQAAERVQETTRTLFELPGFMLVGVMLPLEDWLALGWSGLAFAVLLLVARRLPWMLLMTPVTGFFRTTREVVFAGWFGPIGIAAVFYALFAAEKTGQELLWPIVSLTVFVSTLVHGMTATPWTTRMERGRGHPAPPRAPQRS